jgi:hypothetical protein
LSSEQIRRLLPRAVTALSSRYPQLLWVFARFFGAQSIPRRLVTVNGAPIWAAQLHRSGTAAASWRGLFFMISKPRRGLSCCSESPLSGTAALYPQ